jgi:hypothetical protein
MTTSKGDCYYGLGGLLQRLVSVPPITYASDSRSHFQAHLV